MRYRKKIIIVSMVIFAGLPITGCDKKDSKNKQNLEPGEIFTEEEIPRTFIKANWKFFKGTDGNLGFPREAFLKLVAMNENEARILDSTESLKGFVEIKSCDEALSFVRLFTDLETHYLFKDSKYIEVQSTNKERSVGELNEEAFARLGLKEPVVSKEEEYFIIVRYVLDFSFSDWKRDVFQITEKVSAFGDYKITRKILTAKDVNIVFPMYE